MVRPCVHRPAGNKQVCHCLTDALAHNHPCPLLCVLYRSQMGNPFYARQSYLAQEIK